MIDFNIEAALELYYSQNELSNTNIKQIFGCSNSGVNKLKRKVWEKMAEENVRPLVFDSKNLNVEYAFRVWGLNVDELEKKYKRLQKFRQTRGGEPAWQR